MFMMRETRGVLEGREKVSNCMNLRTVLKMITDQLINGTSKWFLA